MKKGFTIVELLMVVTIIAVLLGIVTTAATASIRAARQRNAQAMRTLVQGGINVYHRQNDKWPDVIEAHAEKGDNWASDSNSDDERERDPHNYNYDHPDDYDKIMKQLLESSTGANSSNPVLDPTGLMVMRAGAPNNKTTGMDYRTAVTEKKSFNVGQMTVGYPTTDGGKAARFIITYNAASDSVSVGLCP